MLVFVQIRKGSPLLFRVEHEVKDYAIKKILKKLEKENIEFDPAFDKIFACSEKDIINC